MSSNQIQAPRDLREGEMFVEVLSSSSGLIVNQGTRVTVTREATHGRHYLCRINSGRGWQSFAGVAWLNAGDFREVADAR